MRTWTWVKEKKVRGQALPCSIGVGRAWFADAVDEETAQFIVDALNEKEQREAERIFRPVARRGLRT